MKQMKNFSVVSNEVLADNRYSLIKLTPADASPLPEGIEPGMFVQVDPRCSGVMLRRPISVCRADYGMSVLWLLVRDAGPGTHAMCGLAPGDTLNIILPLGHGFTLPAPGRKPRTLLVGGGVGVAPLLELGHRLRQAGCSPRFLLGARSAADVLLGPEFSAVGNVMVTTEDGSLGVKGLVTDHPVMAERFDMIYCCGPAPMMKAVAAAARRSGSTCEVSLENMMACGMGACLCCVEKTVRGNVCVCTEGPVFNIDMLTWNN